MLGKTAAVKRLLLRHIGLRFLKVGAPVRGNLVQWALGKRGTAQSDSGRTFRAAPVLLGHLCLKLVVLLLV